MSWNKKIGILILPILVSFYFFPFAFRILPGVNTKMMMAVLGLVIAGIQMAQQRFHLIDKHFISIFVGALLVSLMSLISITLNNTPDTSYATYFVSMGVWLMGAFAVCSLIKSVHGQCTLFLLSNYLIIVCVMQCLLAIGIDQNIAIHGWVNRWILTDPFVEKVHRLYGIGAELDTAGVRFSITLVLLAHLMVNLQEYKIEKYLPFYLMAFAILVVIGNMMARTTSVGIIVGLGYLIYHHHKIESNNSLWMWMLVITALTIPVASYFYNTNADIHRNIRFAFEGFFSLVENGKWEIGSNETLKSMIVFPERLHTWIIGDGYMVNPKDVDVYYTGRYYGGYYMGTDIGYLRFIFYFGTIGLLLFSGYLMVVAWCCIQKNPQYKFLILLILLLNFIVWLKVSTDIFLIFALLWFIEEGMNNKYNDTFIEL